MADATPMNTTPSTPVSSGDWQAAIAYFNILFLYTAWAKSDSPTHMFHAKNGAGLFVVYLGIYILMNILVTVLPVGMMALLSLIMSLVNLLVLVASLYGAWNAWKGKQWSIPVVTGIGQKIPLEKWFHKGSASMASSAPVAPAAAPAQTPAEPAPMPASEAAPAPAPMPAPTAPEAPATPAAPSAPTEPTPPQTPAA